MIVCVAHLVYFISNSLKLPLKDSLNISVQNYICISYSTLIKGQDIHV